MDFQANRAYQDRIEVINGSDPTIGMPVKASERCSALHCGRMGIHELNGGLYCQFHYEDELFYMENET